VRVNWQSRLPTGSGFQSRIIPFLFTNEAEHSEEEKKLKAFFLWSSSSQWCVGRLRQQLCHAHVKWWFLKSSYLQEPIKFSHMKKLQVWKSVLEGLSNVRLDWFVVGCTMYWLRIAHYTSDSHSLGWLPLLSAWPESILLSDHLVFQLELTILGLVWQFLATLVNRLG
jgi:hypothetical protein